MSPHPSFTFIKCKILRMDTRKVPPWIAVCRDGMKSESRNSRYKVSIISSVHVPLKVSYVSSSSSRSVQMISMKWNDVSRFSRWKFTIVTSCFDLCKYTDDILKDVVRIVLYKMTLKKIRSILRISIFKMSYLSFDLTSMTTTVTRKKALIIDKIK